MREWHWGQSLISHLYDVKEDAMSTIDSARQQVRQGQPRLAWLRFLLGSLSPLLYLAPFLLFFAVFQIYPIFYGLYVSLTKWDLVTAPQFIGLTNYINLGKDTLFWTALRNTVLFVVLN